MNQHLKCIITLIEQNKSLTAEQKTAILKSLKEADKELEITVFKLDRTEKVKRTTTMLLEETIQELELKRKAIEETNADIEADPLPFISGHPAEIKQLFQNLIVNAIKFRKKGSIPKIKISAEQKDDYWQFTFADNGIGIEAQYNEKIFVIFQTLNARDEVEAKGVGLAIVKKIIEEEGGSIWLDSAKDKGATFRFCWPKKKRPMPEEVLIGESEDGLA